MRTGWPDPSVFWGTLEVPVPSIDGFLTSLSQPQPEPTPGPAFRGQEEAPGFDVTGGGGGSGSMAAAENNGAPPAFELPLVMAPAIPIPGAVAPTVPVGACALQVRRWPQVPRPPLLAWRAPLIRGSLSPRAETANTSMTPIGGQATRVAYPRFVRTPTVAQLAAVAHAGRGRSDVPYLQRKRHRIPAGQQHPVYPHRGRGAFPLVVPPVGGLVANLSRRTRRSRPPTCASPHRTDQRLLELDHHLAPNQPQALDSISADMGRFEGCMDQTSEQRNSPNTTRRRAATSKTAWSSIPPPTTSGTRERCRRTAPGSSTRSSTRCWSARSTTPTLTARAIYAA